MSLLLKKPVLLLINPPPSFQENGSYTWTDGWPVFFTQWGPGEPSNINGEGCVAMHGGAVFHGTWNDTKCHLAKPFICKISSGGRRKLAGFLQNINIHLKKKKETS